MHAAELDATAPAELHALRVAWSERERRLDWRFGMLAVCVSSPHRDTTAHPSPFHPADFFPSLDDLRPEPPSDDELEAKLRAAFGV